MRIDTLPTFENVPPSTAVGAAIAVVARLIYTPWSNRWMPKEATGKEAEWILLPPQQRLFRRTDAQRRTADATARRNPRVTPGESRDFRVIFVCDFACDQRTWPEEDSRLRQLLI